MTRIGVYGSLLSGLYNHEVLGQYLPTGDAKFIRNDKIKGFQLYRVSSFPGIKYSRDENETVDVEIYDVSDRALRSVRSLEGYHPGENNYFYDEVDAKTESGETIKVYLYVPEVTIGSRIKDGNWRNAVKKYNETW